MAKMTEGSPFRNIVAGLGGAALGAGSIGAVVEVAGKLGTQVEVALLIVVGVIVVTAEVGGVLLASQYLRVSGRLYDTRIFELRLTDLEVESRHASSNNLRFDARLDALELGSKGASMGEKAKHRITPASE
jgi:hypothetical protein